MARKQQTAPRISGDRLAAIAGGVTASEALVERAAPAPRVVLEPDLSRIRPRGVEETPEQRKKRLAAKTINFTFTIAARLIIIAALGLLIWNNYEMTGAIQRGPAMGIFAILVDLGRVMMKAMEPGTK
ncbi:MAG: hypothetical protein KAH44_13455 [Oricola sp.]|jgi:hypothetical protein|nr:hypothetical protein [Oricola sp.]